MIEIVDVKEARYKSVEEVPIEKNKAIKNKKYCQYMQKAYKEIRREFHDEWEGSSKEHEPSEWKEMARIFDRNFINVFLCIWKEDVFEKSKNFSKDELNPEKEKQLIEEVLEDRKNLQKVKEYFLENIPVIEKIIKNQKIQTKKES